jgi:hypothetical protein
VRVPSFPRQVERMGPAMNYYCLDCLKRFYMDESGSDIASCPFCSSEDIEPDVEDKEDAEEELDEDVDLDDDDDFGDENGFDDAFDDDDDDFDDDDDDLT